MKKDLHIHLDPIGGISGDMFIASMINANPKLKPLAENIAKTLLKDIKFTVNNSSNGHISGSQVIVNTKVPQNRHRSYNDIIKLINNSKLNKNTKKISIKIFEILAKAESKIHGVNINKVHFHELGAWDSIIDNVISGAIIEHYISKYNVSWSCSPIPMGTGKILTAHGQLSIPAPATALLLKNIPVIDDGIKGERTTPTGAAIINFISPYSDIASATNENLKILQHGIGVGHKSFDHIPNILRTIIFTKSKSPIKNTKKEIIKKISFDIDDQSPEDLALSLNTLSNEKGVIDISQNPIMGKKGRISINIKILCRVEHANNIIKEVLNETSTIGVRTSLVERFVLNRKISKISNFNIKEVKRPSGKQSKKVESKDLHNYSYKNRLKIRNKIEK